MWCMGWMQFMRQNGRVFSCIGSELIPVSGRLTGRPEFISAKISGCGKGRFVKVACVFISAKRVSGPCSWFLVRRAVVDSARLNIGRATRSMSEGALSYAKQPFRAFPPPIRALRVPRCGRKGQEEKPGKPARGKVRTGTVSQL